MTNHYRAHLLPTHFDFRKTESASSFEKSQILARIRRKTVEDGFDPVLGDVIGYTADGRKIIERIEDAVELVVRFAIAVDRRGSDRC
jgi:hypothetical protein